MPDNIYCIDGLKYSDHRIKTRKFYSIPSTYNELQKGLGIPRSVLATNSKRSTIYFAPISNQKRELIVVICIGEGNQVLQF